METRQTIEAYFQALSDGGDWQAFLGDQVAFTSHVGARKEVAGRGAYVESTRGFYSMIKDLRVERLLVDGNRACALTRYALEPPAGEPFDCEVAEIFEVNDGKIDTFEIYFDSATFAPPG